eukprot:TRINITY_DN3592_c0_g1_i1.p1 TRINITY_DN3592_c0_g1~~TRINITY_DN3592_c0_g1_i1.p1  ORF type:complete len:257 (-),score=49.42 TRINITY_DN3592_c0_g1_i1:127-831(-)
MPVQCALDIVDGITEFTGRAALLQLFSQFGKVTTCWIPPVDTRHYERSYVRFEKPAAAEAALDASNKGLLYNFGSRVRVEWRVQAHKTQDARDFEAAGCNMASSRDIFRQVARDRAAKKKTRTHALEDRKRDRSRRRSADRKRRSRSRSRSRKRSRSRSRSRDKKEKDRRSARGFDRRDRSAERRFLEDGRDTTSGPVLALEDNRTTRREEEAAGGGSGDDAEAGQTGDTSALI